VPDGRLGICEDSSRFHESPARAAALILEGRRVAEEGALKSLVRGRVWKRALK
jgi:hypothetical protein